MTGLIHTKDDIKELGDHHELVLDDRLGTSWQPMPEYGSVKSNLKWLDHE